MRNSIAVSASATQSCPNSLTSTKAGIDPKGSCRRTDLAVGKIGVDQPDVREYAQFRAIDGVGESGEAECQRPTAADDHDLIGFKWRTEQAQHTRKTEVLARQRIRWTEGGPRIFETGRSVPGWYATTSAANSAPPAGVRQVTAVGRNAGARRLEFGTSGPGSIGKRGSGRSASADSSRRVAVGLGNCPGTRGSQASRPARSELQACEFAQGSGAQGE